MTLPNEWVLYISEWVYVLSFHPSSSSNKSTLLLFKSFSYISTWWDRPKNRHLSHVFHHRLCKIFFFFFAYSMLRWKIYFWRDNGKTLNAINFLQEFLSLTIWIPSVCFRIFVVCIRTTIFSSFYICHKSSKYYFVWFSSLQRFFLSFNWIISRNNCNRDLMIIIEI